MLWAKWQNKVFFQFNFNSIKGVEEVQVKDETRPAAPVAGLHHRQDGHATVKDGPTRHRAKLVGREDGGQDRKQAADENFG